ncbi:substrate-binding domain-containing protein [Castellaniella sp.]|uniref:substrate-binding domain-containing protein n=1 Tax=Castellaniella sp. TaxID=1955812 RepID=UPI002AFEA769|nr:substrate-binding domain-containing protein [Castellaniella sp.]
MVSRRALQTAMLLTGLTPWAARATPPSRAFWRVGMLYWSNTIAGQLASYITSNNYQAGYLGGEYLASLFTADTTLRLVLLEYPAVSSTVERLNGFFDGLKDRNRTYQIMNTYRAVTPKAGRAAGQKILQDFPEKNSINALFAVSDGGGLSVVKALADAGRHEIAVASVDGDPADITYAILQGKPVPQHITIPTFPITRHTLSAYPGWAGPIPPSFKKTWASSQPVWQDLITQTRP